MKHIEKIGTVGPQNIHLIDTYKGEIHTGGGKILIDKSLLNEIKFIKEGQFVEKDGAPALKLAGEISGIVDSNAMPRFETVYPYRQKQLEKKLKINQDEFQLLLRKFSVKGNPKYHSAISTGATSKTHKYTEALYKEFDRVLKSEPNLLKTLKKERKQLLTGGKILDKPFSMSPSTPLLS